MEKKFGAVLMDLRQGKRKLGGSIKRKGTSTLTEEK